MQDPAKRPRAVTRAAAFAAMGLLLVGSGRAQQPAGPQSDAPPPVAPAPRAPGTTLKVPAGTRLAVVLENGISTHSAKAGDSLYFHTAFPVTQNNQVVIPVGSYLRGSLLESRRPGRIKGHGEFRMRLESLILPNGYTVDLLAAPRSADTGGKETTDSEGKVTGGGGKGKDAGTIATTTARQLRKVMKHSAITARRRCSASSTRPPNSPRSTATRIASSCSQPAAPGSKRRPTSS